MEYMIVRLMHVIIKGKENEPQSNDAAMMLLQDKGDFPSWHKDIKTCY